MAEAASTSSLPPTTTMNGADSAAFVPTATYDSPIHTPEGFNPNAPVFTPAAESNGNGDHSPPDVVIPLSPSPEIDPQILEALRSKDRIYVLKLGEQMESLITERRFRLDLVPSTSYQRLLVHRCSAYYKLQPESDPVSKGISVSTTFDSRIPSRRLSDLLPPDSATPPAFQIMRRASSNRHKSSSQAGSVAGDDGDLSDVDASEAGSAGGRSNATGGSNKKRMTIEEREAAYNEARSRIFMNFEEKEKEKDLGSSSSLSVVSGSASTSGGSVGDIDDSISSVATESEWSAPAFSRKGRSSTSARSVRSSTHSFSSNGAGSSRDSRAPSPSFNYATLYEPNSTGRPYEAGQLSAPLPGPGFHHPAQYLYQGAYGPCHTPNTGYLAPYPYYSYPYSAPPNSPPDMSSTTGSDMYAPHTQPYHNSYSWPLPKQQPPPHHPQSVPPLPSENAGTSQHAQTSPVGPPFQQPPFVTSPPVYMYPMQGYYPPPPPPGQPMIPPPMPPQPHMVGQLYDPRSGDNQYGNNDPATHNFSGSREYDNISRYPRNPQFNGSTRGRGAPPQPRHAWSYGPGISNHNAPGDVGPRFNSTHRRLSNHSNGSSGNHRSSNWDEVSSTASSSTTSSSSRRTYTSTTSSQHPLPPRPDWAVGLKPDPTLHSTNRHLDSSGNSRNISPISPPRSINGGPHSSVRRPPGSQSTVLQATDFPPLSSLSPAEKRVPVVAGAWTNPPSTRALGQGNALVHHSPNNRLEEGDKFERPPPRATELYNPKKGHAKRSSSSVSARQEVEVDGGRCGHDGVLVDQIRTLSLEPRSIDAPVALD